jgi:hypothetical protein
MNNSAIWAFVNEGGPSEDVELYGNIIDYTDSGQSGAYFVDMDGISNGQAIIATNWKAFNNTVVNWRDGAPIWNMNGGTGIFRNNVYANHPAHDYGPGIGGTASHNAFYNLIRAGVGDVTASWAAIGTNNQIFSSDPFVNYATRDLRLKAATAAGSSVGSPAGNAVDMFGTVRGSDGVWDRGALEFGGTTSQPPSPPSSLHITTP